MKEQNYQSKIIKSFEEKGYYCIKLISTNKNGIADVLALKKGEDPIFIEVKKIKGKLSLLQRFRLTEQKKLGFKTFYTEGVELIEW